MLQIEYECCEVIVFTSLCTPLIVAKTQSLLRRSPHGLSSLVVPTAVPGRGLEDGRDVAEGDRGGNSRHGAGILVAVLFILWIVLIVTGRCTGWSN